MHRSRSSKQVCLHVSKPCEGHKFKFGGQKSGPAMAGMAGTAPTALNDAIKKFVINGGSAL